jgi:hypothetical protein
MMVFVRHSIELGVLVEGPRRAVQRPPVLSRSPTMDLVSGARVIAAMKQTQKGAAKIVDELTLPATSLRALTLIVTELAVEPTPEGLVLREQAPGMPVESILANWRSAAGTHDRPRDELLGVRPWKRRWRRGDRWQQRQVTT